MREIYSQLLFLPLCLLLFVIGCTKVEKSDPVDAGTEIEIDGALDGGMDIRDDGPRDALQEGARCTAFTPHGLDLCLSALKRGDADEMHISGDIVCGNGECQLNLGGLEEKVIFGDATTRITRLSGYERPLFFVEADSPATSLTIRELILDEGEFLSPYSGVAAPTIELEAGSDISLEKINIMYPHGAGLKIGQVDGVRAASLVVYQGEAEGIVVEGGGSGLEIRESNFSGCAGPGVRLEGLSPQGERATIQQNLFDNNHHEGRAVDCDGHPCGGGQLEILDSQRVDVKDNEIRHGFCPSCHPGDWLPGRVDGVFLRGGGEVLLSLNAIYDHSGAAFRFEEGDGLNQIVLSENTFALNGQGLEGDGALVDYQTLIDVVTEQEIGFEPSQEPPKDWSLTRVCLAPEESGFERYCAPGDALDGECVLRLWSGSGSSEDCSNPPMVCVESPQMTTQTGTRHFFSSMIRNAEIEGESGLVFYNQQGEVTSVVTKRWTSDGWFYNGDELIDASATGDATHMSLRFCAKRTDAFVDIDRIKLAWISP